MPTKAKRITQPGQRVARKHAEANQPSRSEKRGRKWYASPTWKQLRREHLAENPHCVDCLAEGKPPARSLGTVVDHVEPHHGTWAKFIDRANLQTLCASHHGRKTAAQDGGFGNRKREGG